MNNRTIISLRQHQIRRVIFFILFLTSCCVEPIPSAGQTTPQKRRLVNLIPHHLPLKIEIRNFDNENWLREMEIEVTNTSGKPVYFLDFFITLPDVKGHSGNPVGFFLKYGRLKLIDLSTPIEPEDVPILPGGIYVLKIGESYLKGWEKSSTRKNLPENEPKKVELNFAYLNFGDGTGFRGTDAKPFDINEDCAN